MAKGFGGGRMPGNMGNMMKQMQKVQRQMEQTQKELEEKTIEASSGGGAVKAVMNGKKELVDIDIEKDIVDIDDLDMLEDLIVACVNSALKEVDNMQEKEMSKITGGLNIPGMI